MESHLMVELTYLLSAILFVVGLKRLQSPATARAGNALAAVAMGLAIVATVIDNDIISWTEILIGVAIGGRNTELQMRILSQVKTWDGRTDSCEFQSGPLPGNKAKGVLRFCICGSDLDRRDGSINRGQDKLRSIHIGLDQGV